MVIIVLVFTFCLCQMIFLMDQVLLYPYFYLINSTFLSVNFDLIDTYWVITIYILVFAIYLNIRT